MKLGFKREITAEDLYQVLPEDESETLGKNLEMFSFFLNKVIFLDYLINCF